MNQPRWRRRSAARPAEIAAAAAAIFAEKGFAAARMSEIAERAGVSKAALYRYYPAKEALFRAVVEESALDMAALSALIDGALDFPGLVPILLGRLAATLDQPAVRQLALMVVAESGNFPELAAVWRDQVVEPAIGALSGSIARAQANGEVRDGDPRLMAMSIIGALLMGAIWCEVIEPAGGAPVRLADLAMEHARTVVAGMLR